MPPEPAGPPTEDSNFLKLISKILTLLTYQSGLRGGFFLLVLTQDIIPTYCFTSYLCIKNKLKTPTHHLCVTCLSQCCSFVVFMFYSVLNQVCFVILYVKEIMKYTVFYCVALISYKYTKV